MKRIITALAAVAAALALMFGATACGGSDSDCQGDAGRVTGKDYDPGYTTGSGKHKVSHSADYDLTITRPDGTTYDKDVTSTAYNDWYRRGGKFPSPEHCENGKAKD